MKVLHFSALDGRSGAGVAAARIHAGLLARGVDSKFCVAYPSQNVPASFTPPISALDRLRRAISFRRNIARLRNHAEADDYVLSTGMVGFDMGKVIRAERPDVVQLYWIAGDSFRLATLKHTAAPVVWRLSDQWPFCGIEHLQPDPAAYAVPPTGPGLSERVRRLKASTYATLESLTLTCPSRWIAAQVGSSALLGDRPAQLIPTSCEIDVFRPVDRAASRQALSLPQDEQIVLIGATSLGTRWKGMDLFLEAVGKLKPRARPMRIVTFGQDAGGGGERFTHLGSLPRTAMAQVFSAADVFVAPSRLENLANTVLEAMACGTPTAAFAVGGMPDLIDHQINGWLAEPYDTDQLAEGIGWLLDHADDPALRAAARRKIETTFSPAGEIDSYISLYQRLLNERRKSTQSS